MTSSTSSVLKAKNWGMLRPSPMVKLTRMCNKKFLLLCDRGRDTIMNILRKKTSLLLIGNCRKPIKGHEKGDVVRGSYEKLGHALHYLKR